MLTIRNILKITSSQCRSYTVKHPTSAKVEYVTGQSAVGVPSAYTPYRADLDKGKTYAWCACGFSKKQPYCDGSHKAKNAELKEGEQKYGPLRFVAEEKKTVLFCMCKASSNRPFCDGTHETLRSNKKA